MADTQRIGDEYPAIRINSTSFHYRRNVLVAAARMFLLFHVAISWSAVPRATRALLKRLWSTHGAPIVAGRRFRDRSAFTATGRYGAAGTRRGTVTGWPPDACWADGIVPARPWPRALLYKWARAVDRQALTSTSPSERPSCVLRWVNRRATASARSGGTGSARAMTCVSQCSGVIRDWPVVGKRHFKLTLSIRVIDI